MVNEVFICKNGVVLVFDLKGNQIPKLQGKWIEKAKHIFKACTYETKFYDKRV
jgi:hypothetical protein